MVEPPETMRPARRLARAARGGEQVHPVVPVEAPILRVQKGGDEVGIHAVERQPAPTAAVDGARVAQDSPLTVPQDRPRLESGSEELGWDRPRYPRGDRERNDRPQQENRCAGSTPDRGHRDLLGAGTTVNVPPSLSPYTAGLYISSA